MTERDDGATSEPERWRPPIGRGGWFIPGPAVLAGNAVRWQTPRREWVQASPDIVDQFARTGTRRLSSDSAVLRLASRWGPLFRNYGRPGDKPPPHAESHPSHYDEPLDAWTRLIGDVQGCLAVAARIRATQYVERSDWDLFGNVRLLGELGSPARKGARASAIRVLDMVAVVVPGTQEALLSGPEVDPLDPTFEEPAPGAEEMAGTPLQVVGTLIDLLLHPVRLRLVAAETTPRLELTATSLLGAIGLGLAQKVILESDLTVCANCGRVFEPYRPRPGEASWCRRQECKRASRSAAAKRYRERRKVSNAPEEPQPR